MNQRGWSLLETMLSLFLISSLMFTFTEILIWQQKGFEQLKQRVGELYTALGIYEELRRLVSEVRPFFCAMPGQLDAQTYKVVGIDVFRLYKLREKLHLKVYASSGDLIPMENKKHLSLPNCQESWYLLTDYKLGFILQAFSCQFRRPIFVEDIPKALSSPYFIIPIYYKEYVIDKDKFSLHAKGVPQVLFSGFSHLNIRLQTNGLNVELQLPHFGTLTWEHQFCVM